MFPISRSLLAIAGAFFTGTHGLDVHCDLIEVNSCYVKEHLDLHVATTLNFIPAIEYNDVSYFSIPSHNNVSIIPSGIFTTFVRLNQVRISTGLKSIQKDNFKNADAMTTLELNENKLQVIPSNVFSEASLLRQIDLSDNELNTIEDFAFKGLNNLDLIYLQYNNLTIVTRNTFAGTRNLNALYLHENQIEVIEDGAFALAYLQHLYLANNLIRTLSDNVFVGAPSLFAVSLVQNGLTHIGQSFYRSRELHTVLLDNNNVEDIDLSSFAKLPALYQLSLENIGFHFSENDMISTITKPSNVSHLNLKKNEISNANVLKLLKSFGYVNLENLFLDGNNLRDVLGLAEIRQRFPKIISLGLSDNELTCEWMERAVETLKPPKVEIKQNVELNSKAKNFKGITCV